MDSGEVLGEEEAAAIRRRVRILMLLDAAEHAGISPLPLMRLHAIAFLTNVLAPVWDMPGIDGEILKRHGGPFYPQLQNNLDRLVGQGMVLVADLRHTNIGVDRWCLEGSYRINYALAKGVISHLDTLPEEQRAKFFIKELLLALSGMSDDEIDAAFKEDATYADKRTGIDNIIDFSGGRSFSANAAEQLARMVPTEMPILPQEKIHLYVRHLQHRMAVGD